MQIIWYGQTCFKIITQKGKNGSVTILIDPFDSSIGLRPPKNEADILIFTHDSDFIENLPIPSRTLDRVGARQSRDNKRPISGNTFLIEGPGEYDLKSVYIQGIPALTKNSSENSRLQGKIPGKIAIYTIEAEEMKICHLGILGQRELTLKELEVISEVDILLIPIGGGIALDAKEAIKIMTQIEPKIIIPMYYKIPGLKIGLNTLDKFLKLLGIKKIQPLPKLSIKKQDISREEAKIIVLES